jgi:hypothetical protein
MGEGSASPGTPRNAARSRRARSALLIGQNGFPLMLSAFKGHRAETKTMLLVIEKFTAAPVRRHRRRGRGQEILNVCCVELVDPPSIRPCKC